MSRHSLRRLADNPEERRVWKQREAVKGETMLGRLQAHLNGTLDLLTQEEQRVYERWSVTWRMLCGNAAHGAIRKYIMEQYGVTEVTAVRDIAYAAELFGQTTHVQKKASKAAYIEDLKVQAAKFKKDGDSKAWLKAMELLMQAEGFDKDIEDAVDYAKLQPHQYAIEVKSEAIDKLVELVGNRTVISVAAVHEAIEDAEVVTGDGGDG